MNVLLVKPSCGCESQVKSAPLGLLSIASYLKERGCCVHIYDRIMEKRSPEEAARAFWPDAVGVSVASTADVHDGVKVSRWFRKKGIPVIWGGQFASLVPEMVLKEGRADYVVMEEGEITFHELLRAIETKSGLAEVEGIAYLGQSGAVCRTPAREFADLADFPAIDWSLINPAEYFFPDTETGSEKMLCLYSSKGCPGHCAFCYNRLFHHSKHRKRPSGQVLAEMKELAEQYGMDGVYFVDDDMFGGNKSDLRDFCEQLRSLGLNVVWRCFANIGRLSSEDFRLMYEAGCRKIFCGLESGSPETLKCMRKTLNIATLENDVRSCHEAGIWTECSFVLGFPGETEGQLRDTVRLLLRLEPNLTKFQILMYFPVPGTEKYIQLVEAGRLTPPRTLREWGRHGAQEDMFDNFSDVPTRDLRVVQAHFYWKMFTRKTNETGAARRKAVRRAFISLLRKISRQNFFNMFKFTLSSAKLFLTIAWYSHAYPGVRRKYGIECNEKAL